ELAPLTLGAVLRAQRAGAQIVDTRSPAEFAGGHLGGSTHIDLAGRFESWAETLLSKNRPIVLVCAPGSERAAVAQLERAGLDRVIGYLHGGIEGVKRLAAPARHAYRATASASAWSVAPSHSSTCAARTSGGRRRSREAGTSRSSAFASASGRGRRGRASAP